eukprot:8898683-Ditylum_brightwellii.AAC.1
MKAIAACPQTTNKRCDEYNRAVVKAVQHTGADVVSIAFERLDTEQTYIDDMMLSLLTIHQIQWCSSYAMQKSLKDIMDVEAADWE